MASGRNSPNVAIGIAGVMGCYMTILAVASIFIGLAIDGALGGQQRIATLICIIAGIPLNLISAVWITMLLIKRAIPDSPYNKGRQPQTPPQAEDGEPPNLAG